MFDLVILYGGKVNLWKELEFIRRSFMYDLKLAKAQVLS
jgi:hypothetical protein